MTTEGSASSFTPLLISSLLETVEGRDGGSTTDTSSNHQPLVDLFLHQHPSIVHGSARDQRVALLGSIATFDKRQARRFFHAVGTILSTIVEEELFCPESAYDDDDEEEEFEAPTGDARENMFVSDAEAALALEFVKVTALCMESYITSEARGSKMLDEVHAVMLHLHNCLLSLQAVAGDDGLVVQSKIASLCEYWWKSKHEWKDREDLVVQLMPLLVARSVDDESAATADVKRLYQMRHAFDVLDFDDESSQDIKSLLLRTLSSPLYLREGKRVLAYLYQHMPTDLHQAMRAQIPNAKKAVLEAYGEILFRAWKDSGEARNTFEDVILRDFTYAILHVGSSPMVKSLHLVLEPFHHQAKNTVEIQQLLHRLYGPILWRSLRAANAHVRVHAASVLAQVFPLADGANVHKAVQKAVAALQALLMDTVPSVREAGSSATATVLATYWDALPAPDIRLLLTHILDRHACDVSSSAVRAGAVSAITQLLDAPQSHAVLRERLPALANLIHDKVERVRLATVRLLHKIKTSVPDIKYYKVVPVQHLLARLEQDARKNMTNPMASALTNLMMNSYFPQNSATGAEQVRRTLTFLSTNPVPASVFYANLSKHLEVNSVAKLASMLLKCLVKAVEHDVDNSKKRRRSSINDEALTAQNTSLMASLAETICSLWESIASDLATAEHEPSHQFLLDAFTGAVLANVNSHFDEKAEEADASTDEGLKVMDDCHRVCASILRCAGRLQYSSVKELAEQIKSKLDSIDDDDAANRENITPHVALLCLWGKTDDVATSLATSMVQSFGGDIEFADFSLDDSSKKRRKSSRRSKSSGGRKKNLNVPQLPPHVAMRVLENILRGADPSSSAARDAILSTPSACSTLEQALDKGRVHAEQLLSHAQEMNESDVELLLRTCETYGRFALHKAAAASIEQNNGATTLSPQAQTLLDWTTLRVVPVLTGRPTVASATPFRDLDLSRISTVPDTPASPEPTPPQSKRTDRKKTPLKLDSSFQSVDQHKMTVDMDGASCFMPSVSFSRVAAISLLQSACVLFSEWLAVGLLGANEIAAAAAQWCVIFAANDDDEQLQTELLPSFLRLSVQLGKLESNFTVLGQLMEKCTESSTEENQTEEAVLVKKSIGSLLTGRNQFGSSMLKELLEEFVRAARAVIADEDDSPNQDTDMDEAPSTVQEVWGLDCGYIVPILTAVTSNKKACVTLAEMFVGDLKGKAKDDENMSDAMMLFQVRCLWFLCEHASDATGVQKVIRTNLSDTNAAQDFEGKDEGLQNLVDKLTALYA